MSWSLCFTPFRSVLPIRYRDVNLIAFGTPIEEDLEQRTDTPSILSEFPPLQSSFPKLFVAFWSLRLSDLQYPKEA